MPKKLTATDQEKSLKFAKWVFQNIVNAPSQPCTQPTLSDEELLGLEEFADSLLDHTPGSQTFYKPILIAKRWWLSFVKNGVFQGVCIVDAQDPMGAQKRASELGINPGGEVMVIEVPNEPEANAEVFRLGMDRLIGLDELKADGASQIKDLPDDLQDRIDADPAVGMICEKHNA